MPETAELSGAVIYAIGLSCYSQAPLEDLEVIARVRAPSEQRLQRRGHLK